MYPLIGVVSSDAFVLILAVIHFAPVEIVEGVRDEIAELVFDYDCPNYDGSQSVTGEVMRVRRMVSQVLAVASVDIGHRE